ncbi:MAG: putative aminopeptidase [Pedosphaera sp.]|nr:putative aminopeptidase [Pedosphaera sp.]
MPFRAGLILGLCAGATVFETSAQTGPQADRITDLEKQIQTLKQTVEELKRSPSTNATPLSAGVSTNLTSSPSQTNDPIARIREEGLNHSQVMQTLSYLSDVIGPRLTASPNLKRANEWTREKLCSWGLTNAHLEAWGPFGRGWSVKRFSAQIVEPQSISLIGYPKAWSPGFDQPLVTEVIYLDAKTDADLEKYAGKLKGAIVLNSPVTEVKAHFEPLAVRMVETNLLQLANAAVPRQPTNQANGAAGPGRRRGGAPGLTNTTQVARGSNAPAGPGGRNRFQPRFLNFLAKEGAALVVNPSVQGDGGTFYVAAASVPTPEGRGTNAPRISAWATNVPPMPAQITIAAEDYNRMMRMIQQGEKLKMAVDLQVQFHDEDTMVYNTIAEIPGSDLKNEVVMIGAHMDSWHSGTGATDNGAGVAATMEAVRILEALKLKPRRTIRIGLWSGEEQGLYGSKAYVSNHFGYYTNLINAVVARSPKDERAAPEASTNSSPTRKLICKKEYETLSAYFNLDNGAGKIRGVYMQGNEAVRPIFRRWLEPFSDLGAETLTPSNTGGTDHLSFDAIGLPGFQFIQDPIEYGSRTHHSNADVYDRVPAEDMKQSSVIMAAFLYDAAMMDEKLPRKPAD